MTKISQNSYAMITSVLIALMISFGFISSDSDYENLSQAQQEYYQEIIIDDSIDL